MPGKMMEFSPELYAELQDAIKKLGIPAEEKSMSGKSGGRRRP